MLEGYELQEDLQKTNSSNPEGTESSKLENFFDNDSIKANQQTIENILNKEENRSLKEGFENFVLTEKNILKVNAVKLKLSKATDETTIKSIIAEVVEGGYKIGDEKIGNEKSDTEGNGELEDNLQQAVQNEEQAVQDEEVAEEEEEQAEEKKEQTEEKKKGTEEKKKGTEEKKEEAVQNTENTDIIKIANEAKTKRDELRYKYDGLKQKTDVGSDLYSEVENNLKNSGVINQLEEIGKSMNDSNFVKNYISLQATLQELKTNSANYESSDISALDKIVKNLDNACNIADTTSKSFNFENIGQTRIELFNEDVGNQSLIKARENNMNSHGETYDKLFPKEMGEDDIINKYGNFLEGDSILEGDLKTFWQNYKNNPDETKNKINEIKNNPNPSDEDKKFLQDYEGMILKLKEIKGKFEEKTKDMMEELCILSQIKGMFMCMGKGDDFNLNKANEIRYDEKGAMILDGHVDGVKFSIRQDINNPEAKLQTSQKLARFGDGEIFSVGKENNFVDSNFILPNQNEIFGSITETVASEGSSENFDNIDKYLENLQTNIMGNIDKKFVDTEYVHHYMKDQVKGEKIVDNSLSFIQHIKPGVDFTEPISQSSKNKDLYQFMRVLKFNIDNSTDVEKDRLNQCITKIQEITDNYRNNNGVEDFVTLKYPSVIDNYLKNKEWLNGGNENSRLLLLSGLFEYYNEKSQDTIEGYENGFTSKIMVNDLYRDLFESNNGNNQSQTADKRDTEQKLNAYDRETQEQAKDAEMELDSVLDDDKTFPPSPKAPWME